MVPNKHALVIGASGGIGGALLTELEERGYLVQGLSRRVDNFDITNEAIVSKCLAEFDHEFDLVVVATGTLSGGNGPEKSIRDVSGQEMALLFAVNTIGPALVLKHVKKLLPRDRKAAFVVLSARVGSIGDNFLGGWYSYRASKAALNQMIRTASIELGRTHRQLVCASLHPGTVETRFTQNYPQHEMVSPQVAARQVIFVIEALKAEDTGGFFDWAGNTVPW